MPTVREEIATMRSDIGWIKRGMLGLYGLIGAWLAASVIAGHSPQQTAQIVGHLIGV